MVTLKKFSSRFDLFESLFKNVEWTRDFESVYENKKGVRNENIEY